MEKFALGILVGGLCGAVLAANNQKMRTLIKKGQEEVVDKFDQMLDDKIEQMEKGAKKAVDAVKDKAEEVQDKVKSKAKAKN